MKTLEQKTRLLQEIALISYHIREDESKYVSWGAELAIDGLLTSVMANNVCCFACGVNEIWEKAIVNIIYYRGTRHSWNAQEQRWESWVHKPLGWDNV